MLTHLHITNFTLVESLDIEMHRGLTALTGETGAGKSILLDALALALGDRADADKVRTGADKAEIHASFDISSLPHAQKWLKSHDLGPECDENDEVDCILRRIVTKEGRSRAYINGQTVTLSQLRGLGEMLIDIHNQHEHQSLLKTATHQRLLDEFAGAQPLAKTVKSHFKTWQQLQDRLQQAQHQSDETDARFQLLSYQVNELDQLGLERGELAALEKEQQQLASGEQSIQNCQHIVDLCSADEGGIITQLNRSLQLLSDIPGETETLTNVAALLNSALISMDEAQSDLHHHIDSFEADPQRLHEVEQRLSEVYTIARKHKIAPEELVQHHEQLTSELALLAPSDALLENLERELEQACEIYRANADKLAAKREKAAKKLAKEVNAQFKQLAMAHATLEIALNRQTDSPSKNGHEQIEFLISTQPDQPAKPLHKVASGGELSRVSLAIQVITAQTSTIPTLVFDEVDVGIGGTTGDVVGKMLRELGARGQVFCVTHLAQVASKAHTHLRVEKTISKTKASSTLTELTGEARVEEIARMMGGTIDSKRSLEHAREIIKAA